MMRWRQGMNVQEQRNQSLGFLKEHRDVVPGLGPWNRVIQSLFILQVEKRRWGNLFPSLGS
jgi:hypothetical protein